tara:strand:- start:63620 stop:63913 length:294 start_codon:yes stop_codon:yes gene_type:complete
MIRWILMACGISSALGCGAKQAGTEPELIERVCVHAMQVAKKEQIGDFTMEQCRAELQKRSETLRGGFRGWANCLLNMNSIEEAKLTCRESDFLNPG